MFSFMSLHVPLEKNSVSFVNFVFLMIFLHLCVKITCDEEHKVVAPSKKHKKKKNRHEFLLPWFIHKRYFQFSSFLISWRKESMCIDTHSSTKPFIYQPTIKFSVLFGNLWELFWFAKVFSLISVFVLQ